MKSITEFPNHKLIEGIKAKTTLAEGGKTPEEIQTALGESFKLEGDKLKHFVNAIEVASKNAEGLSRVLVVALNEGENAPPKALKVEEHHYVPDFIVGVRPPAAPKPARQGGGKGGGKGGRNDRGGGKPRSGGSDAKRGPN